MNKLLRADEANDNCKEYYVKYYDSNPDSIEVKAIDLVLKDVRKVSETKGWYSTSVKLDKSFKKANPFVLKYTLEILGYSVKIDNYFNPRKIEVSWEGNTNLFNSIV